MIRLSATRGRRTAAIAAMCLMALAYPAGARPRQPAPAALSLPAPVALVPVARIVNEVKCDYLDFAYSDYARQRQLPLGKVRATLQLSLSRIGTAAALGVPVAAGEIRLDGDAAPVAPATNGLTLSFELDPALALDPAGARLDCSPARRLSRTILDVTQLAAQLDAARHALPAPGLRSPLRYQGQFFLRRAGSGIDVVLVRVDPARLGRELTFLQSFDVTIETGAASWFADVGPATAEPRARLPAAPPAALPATAPRIELGPVRDAPVGARRGIRVPLAPRRAGSPPPAGSRCIADAGGELACY